MSRWPFPRSSPDDQDLIRVTYHPPLFVGGDNWANRLRIGFLIDWLDSRPEHALADNRRLNRQPRIPDAVRECAAFLSGRTDTRLDCLTVNGHYFHDTSYGEDYHLNVAGHLSEDELPLARSVYERLRRVDRTCLSALANLAELERRAGRMATACHLLDEAIERSTTSTGLRHRVDDRGWELPLRCARARIEPKREDPASLLPLATYENVSALVERLREIRVEKDTAVLVHRAFGAASVEQRLFLHVAMKVAAVFPFPPPSFHESFEVMAEVERLARAVPHWHLIKPGK